MSPPIERRGRPATPPEKLEAARHRIQARKAVRALTFNTPRLRDRRVLFRGREALQPALSVPLCREIPDAVMAVLAPHLEPFIDIDGRESLRITQAGIAATARPRR